MKCLLCGNSNLFLLKTIQTTRIFECRRCALGITERRQTKKLYRGSLYNFKAYNKERKKHEDQLQRAISAVVSHVPSGNILDVGAGYGLFSSLLSKRGRYTIDAVEPVLSLKYIRNNRSIKIFRKTFEKLEKQNIHSQYDAIVFLDVLEHFDNPLEILQKIKVMLKKTGYLVIQLPNYKSFMARICWQWAWWMIEDHRYHFSEKSMRILLEKTGFHIVERKSYEMFDDFKKNLDGNFEIIPLFLRRSIKIITYPVFFTWYFLFRTFFWRMKKGGLLLIVAEKGFQI